VPEYQDANDVFQNTSTVLWKKFDEYSPGTDFFAWACQIARYEVFAHYRRGRRHSLFSEEVLDALAAEVALRGEELDQRAEALGGCLEKLEPGDRMLIEERYFHGRKTAEIAQRLSRSAASVYRSLNRIHDRLFRCIERALSREF